MYRGHTSSLGLTGPGLEKAKPSCLTGADRPHLSYLDTQTMPLLLALMSSEAKGPPYGLTDIEATPL